MVDWQIIGFSHPVYHDSYTYSRVENYGIFKDTLTVPSKGEYAVYNTLQTSHKDFPLTNPAHGKPPELMQN